MASFKWVTTLGNIKSAITGTYRTAPTMPDAISSFAWR